MAGGTALLCAGGTGGHLFPAEALAHELVARGWTVHLATDKRAERFAGDFPGGNVHIIHSATVAGKNPISLIKTFLALYKGYRQSRKLIRQLSPDVVVGFGGYPTVPPVFAASRMGIPTMIHEQNSVLGRANRFLAAKAKIVAVGFEQVTTHAGEKVELTGNPVRPMVHRVMHTIYPRRKVDDPFNLLVFGGSQGARFFSEVFPPAIDMLGWSERALLNVVQQARPEDEAELKRQYANLGVKVRVSPFFKNMPEEIARANYVVSRAGASTITEIAVIGRPALLVPYPGSLDGDQAWNATAMERSGGGEVVKQSELTPEELAKRLKKAIHEPKMLALAAENAKNTGMPDATEKLADCVERISKS